MYKKKQIFKLTFNENRRATNLYSTQLLHVFIHVGTFGVQSQQFNPIDLTNYVM